MRMPRDNTVTFTDSLFFKIQKQALQVFVGKHIAQNLETFPGKHPLEKPILVNLERPFTNMALNIDTLLRIFQVFRKKSIMIRKF